MYIFTKVNKVFWIENITQNNKNDISKRIELNTFVIIIYIIIKNMYSVFYRFYINNIFNVISLIPIIINIKATYALIIIWLSVC